MLADSLRSQDIKATEIHEHIFLVHGKNRSRSPYSNSVLVAGSTNILIDTGCGPEVLEKLLGIVSIDTVILSHCHPDHTSGTWQVLEKTNPLIAVPAQSRDVIGDAGRLSEKLVGKALAHEWSRTYLPAIGYRDFTPGRAYSDGDVFSTDDITLKAVHAPGHISDHFCLWEPEKKILFGFDIDLSPFGPWYGNEESDIDLFIDSIAMARGMPFETYVSSHAKPMSRSHAIKRLDAYASTVETRDSLMAGIFERGRPSCVEDVTWLSPIYGCDYLGKMDRVLFYGEGQMILKHLVRLEKKGILVREGEAFLKTG